MRILLQQFTREARGSRQGDPSRSGGRPVSSLVRAGTDATKSIQEIDATLIERIHGTPFEMGEGAGPSAAASGGTERCHVPPRLGKGFDPRPRKEAGEKQFSPPLKYCNVR